MQSKSINLKELEDIFQLMSKHNVRQLTVGTITVFKDPIQAQPTTKQKKNIHKDPLDELLALTTDTDE